MKTSRVDSKGKVRNSKKILIGKCKFPFKYQCRSRKRCVAGKDGLWCATSLTKRGYTDKWAFCNYKKSKTLRRINREVKRKLRVMKHATKMSRSASSRSASSRSASSRSASSRSASSRSASSRSSR